MANSGYFSHTNLDGNGPNSLVREAGYMLPDSYGMELESNNIESIAAGYENAGDTLVAWINSPGHRTHVFGEIPFHREQVDFGVGFAFNPNSEYGFYWVFISASSTEKVLSEGEEIGNPGVSNPPSSLNN